MKKMFFNAVTSNTKAVGDGTVGQLIDWLEMYVNVLFPDNGIEHWADYSRHSSTNTLKREDLVPTADHCSDDAVHHPAAYVRNGTCEGLIIEALLYMRGGDYRGLFWIKTFGSEDESWLIARAIGHALDSLIAWHELPELVDMARKLPRPYRWQRETSLAEEVTILTSTDRLLVSTPSGLVLDDRSWAHEGVNARFHVEPRAKDWVTVLTNMKDNFKQVAVAPDQLVVPDLPGYVISKRGVDVEGFYVLPPGGNELDDRAYLGYFPDADAAIGASREHQNRQMPVAA